ncbi:MAG: hypothetical protein LH702_31445 [Phormidesmis sp. CAN_BIN44]|nr:hypothetical protein [Phormidesmis sp. CAN_BIN44]
MRSQVHSSPAFSQADNQPRFKILESRSQYQSCHIRVPDESDRLAAIQVGDQYYSFFKVVKERQKTLQVAARLVYRGDEVVITHVSKGDVIWVLEPDARLNPTEKPANRLYKILQDDWEYESCVISVPDIAQPLEAIFATGKYYSLLRVVKDREAAIELADRLTQKGNETVITQSDRGFSIWVLEPDAYMSY